MTGLIKHLHEFARALHLTGDAWFDSIQFVTGVGRQCDDKRKVGLQPLHQ
jgi:hypothetical protein